MTDSVARPRTRAGGVRLAFIAAVLLAGVVAPRPMSGAAQNSPRFFAETGFSISNDAFWNYFQHRGGLRTFGYPTSRELTLEGFRVQFFQRQVMQLRPDGGVQLVNLLDNAVLPYTHVNDSTFPAVDQSILNAGPSPSDADYGGKVVDFVRNRAPDIWNGKPVAFGTTALSFVTFNDAFPSGDGQASLVPLISVLELTGLPASAPAADPNNNNFVYQRFQRVILQYDASTNTTNALLLADYLKAIVTGQNLPVDLDADAKTSKYYHQYDRRFDKHVARPDALPNTDLTDAFEREDKPLPDLAPGVSISLYPTTPTIGTAFTVTVSATDDHGIASVGWMTQGSGDIELDTRHDAACDGTRICTRTWSVTTRLPGPLVFQGVSRDSASKDGRSDKLTVQLASSQTGALEQPSANTKLGGTVAISGWAVDRAAPTGTGVQVVNVYLDGSGEQGSGFFLGAATYGQSRDDVATQLGSSRFQPSGYTLSWDASRAAPGEHTLNVFALSSVTGRWQKFSVPVTVVAMPYPSDPRIQVLDPTDNATLEGTGRTISGWAVDRNASSGTGVDSVEVWMDGPRGTGGAVSLGTATYGAQSDSAVAELHDDRFRPSGFRLTWNPGQFRTGSHVLYVYAHSTYTGTWHARQMAVVVQ